MDARVGLAAWRRGGRRALRGGEERSSRTGGVDLTAT